MEAVEEPELKLEEREAEGGRGAAAGHDGLLLEGSIAQEDELAACSGVVACR